MYACSKVNCHEAGEISVASVEGFSGLDVVRFFTEHHHSIGHIAPEIIGACKLDGGDTF